MRLVYMRWTSRLKQWRFMAQSVPLDEMEYARQGTDMAEYGGELVIEVTGGNWK